MEIENAEELINSYLKWNVKKIADYTGLGYLNCNEGMWKDCGDNLHEIEEMSTKYLKNCKRELKNGIQFCKTIYAGQMGLIEAIENIGDFDEIKMESNIENANLKFA